jgi:dihydroxy-acid dehydratase
MAQSTSPRRSRAWFDTPELYGWLRTAALRAQGFTPEAIDDRPIIGICNTWSELTHCNAHLRQLADAARRGVWQAGGLPLEFPVLSTGEFNMRPTAMLFRNLASMDVEEAVRANPLDGVVLLGGCDKTVPALLMGAASADVPAVLVSGGPQLNGNWRGEAVGSCTDCRRYQTELRAGRITEADWADLQGCIIRSPGHCMTMGTASTMACVAEALGIAPAGNGATPAPDSRRLQIAESAGRYAVDLANRDGRPSHILTPAAFDNAIRVLHAIGGSTNAVIHLIAIAGRLGIGLPLERFDELSRTTPFLLDLKPAGRFLMEDFFDAGGVPALVGELAPLLDLTAPTVTGRTLGENCAGAQVWNREVIRPLSQPLNPEGGLAVLRGSLAPKGAVIKPTAATPSLMTHRGRAVVFEDHDDLNRRIDDPALDVRPDDVLVLRSAGPIGGPGMPEWGLLPIPKKLLAAGVRDMVRISDARMSGTAFGTVVVHVSPESAAGGPLAAVRNGDMIELEVPNRRLDLLVEPAEVTRRLAEAGRREPGAERGYRWLYARHVLQADAGCDFDFLRAGGAEES